MGTLGMLMQGGMIRALLWSALSWSATSMCLYRYLHPRFSVLECLWGGVSLGWSFAALISYVAVVAGGGFGDAPHASFALLGCDFIFAVWFVQGFIPIYRQKHIDENPKKTRNGLVVMLERLWKEMREMWLLQLLTIASLIYFLRSFKYHVLMRTRFGEHWAYGSVYGDLPIHLSIISSFLYGENSIFPHQSTVAFSSDKAIAWIQQSYLPKSTIFSGEQLVYPFIPDFHSALLTFFLGDESHENLRNAIIYPSTVLVTSFVVLLYCFNLRLFEQKRYVAALIAVLLTLLSGGLGGFEFLKGPMSLETIAAYDWAQATETIGEIYWFHLVCHILLPQRSTIFAYPIALIVLSVLHSIFYDHHKIELEDDIPRRASFLNEHTSALVIAIFATGLLPLLQPHSLVALAVFCAAFLVFKFPYKAVFRWIRRTAPLERTELVRLLVTYGIWVAIVTIPQLILAGYFSRISQPAEKTPFVRVEPIWRILKQGNIGLQWTISLGLFPWISLLGLFCFGGISLRGTNEKLHGVFVGSTWMIFLFANFVILQPWERDNTKVFYIWLFAAASSAALFIAKLWCPPYRGWHLSRRLIATLIVASMLLTGFLMLLREERMGGSLWDDDAVKLAKWVKLNTGRTDVFYTDPMTHAHPIHALAGRAAFLGYLGWLDSHGHSTDHRWSLLHHLFAKETSPHTLSNIVKRLNLSYILVGPSWTGEYWTPDPSALAAKAQLVYSANGYRLYDLRNLPNHPKHIEDVETVSHYEEEDDEDEDEDEGEEGVDEQDLGGDEEVIVLSAEHPNIDYNPYDHVLNNEIATDEDDQDEEGDDEGTQDETVTIDTTVDEE
eukprot:TRINITY_DN1248_c0_g1_i1.p1 TRINITY_DN1248_c0_g1~~TRINITY_DN1248_c0_g1_i1.p1  ORF type:complete len:837 (-),score=138.29 TRINITY_DN1248_c0_g1_i1:193-2703(-)